MTATLVSPAQHRAMRSTDEALAELRRIDKVHMLKYADDFERAAEGHPEIKTRLALRLAALLRALAAEQSETGGTR